MLLAHSLVSLPLLHKIRHNNEFIEMHPGTTAAKDREADVTGEWEYLLAFFAFYLLFVLAFSLLSTAAVVYTVACIYSEKSLSYTKVLSVVPRVWRRLVITFLWVFLLIFAYHAVAILIFHLVFKNSPNIAIPVLVIIILLLWIFFFGVHVYISCIWHLASVITVLEDSYGIHALMKSIDLIRGSKRAAIQLFILYLGVGTFISIIFHAFVLYNHGHDGSSLFFRLLYGIMLVILLTFVTLFGMVAQTVFYFACKAFHNEQIDWVALSEHLGAYLGEYVPLKSSIQMESL
ncbi:hypothetical protein KP509_01G107200 [Ceratopteris richardii]|nr:hypothetical protein KP509_01G107200 [Ceratopteris richardii]